ncbi:MAG: hypothetical protein ACRDIE_03255 [Chloroflexota bacterium]
MFFARRSLCVALAVLGLSGATGIAVPGRVSATTGPTQFLPAPKYKVNNKTELLYKGQYVLKSVAKGARLNGGAMGIEINDDDGALYGIAQFYGYDRAGEQSTWVGSLYNFQLLKTKVMNIEVLAPSGRPVLAKLALSRTAKGDLTGKIHLSNGTFAITWQKLTSR